MTMEVGTEAIEAEEREPWRYHPPSEGPTDSELRIFAIGQFVLVIVLCISWDGWTHPISIWSRIASLTSLAYLIVGCIAPQLTAPIFRTWSQIVEPIGWFVSHVLMAIVYYGVVTPTGWLVRMIKGDPLKRQLDSSATTYWERRDEQSKSSNYFRQF